MGQIISVNYEDVGGGGKEYNLKKGQIKASGTLQSVTFDKALESGKQYSICIGSDGAISGESGYYRNNIFAWAGTSQEVSLGRVGVTITGTTASATSGTGYITADNAWIQIQELTFLTEDE